MMPLVRSLLFGVALACVGAPAHGQDRQDKPAPQASPGKNDIIVNGEIINDPVKSPLPGSVGKLSRDAASDAYQFVRCLNGVPAKLQRSIVEGHFRDPHTQDALDQLIQTNTACYPRLFRRQLYITTGYYGVCNPAQAGIRSGQTNADGDNHSLAAAIQVDMALCRASYDRGAIIEEAFRTHAPHFMLTRADTLNKEVVARFRAREAVRGKLRGPSDRRYYETVSCMVQLEPGDAVRLLRAEPGGDHETRLRLQILANTRYCTGNAKKVSVDPSQFRGYLADAVYHWTIAAKDIDTLIPG